MDELLNRRKPSLPMNTRIANREDINKIVKLRLVNAKYHASLLSDVAVQDNAEAYFNEHTNKCVEDDKSIIIIGTLENVIIAYGIGQIEELHPVLDFGNQATIDDIFVSPTFERRGYGEVIVQELMRWFTEKSVERIDLNVYTSNPKGSAFWDKLGFEEMFRRMYREV